MTEQTETRGDPRLDFLQELTLKCLRLKPDKWARMIVSDEQRCFIQSFIEKGKVDHTEFVFLSFAKLIFSNFLHSLGVGC